MDDQCVDERWLKMASVIIHHLYQPTFFIFLTGTPNVWMAYIGHDIAETQMRI